VTHRNAARGRRGEVDVTPTDTLETARSRGQRASSAPSTRSVRRQTSPSAADARSASAAAPGGVRSGQTSTSQSAASASSASPGRRRVANTRGRLAAPSRVRSGVETPSRRALDPERPASVTSATVPTPSPVKTFADRSRAHAIASARAFVWAALRRAETNRTQ
jgi:hypothetical protein